MREAEGGANSGGIGEDTSSPHNFTTVGMCLVTVRCMYPASASLASTLTSPNWAALTQVAFEAIG